MENNENRISSGFHSGASQLERLNALQEQLNSCKIQPLAIFDNGMIGIDVWFNTLNCLYLEIRSKCSAKEKIDTDKLFIEIRDILDRSKNRIYIVDERLSSTTRKNINQEVYNLIIEFLIFLEGIIKNLMEVHKLNIPTQEGDFD